MIDNKKYFDFLSQLGIELLTGVPDSLLNDFCLYAEANIPSNRHIIAANEGNAIAIASGFHLATGSISMVYMQNSGMGNALNPLLSLTNRDVFSIPMLLLIGWRGDPSIKDHAQHIKQGILTPILLDEIDIPYTVLDLDDSSVFTKTEWAYNKTLEIGSPVALLVKKGVFEKGSKDSGLKPTKDLPLSREAAIGILLDCLPSDAIYVATTGRATRELFALREIRGDKHNNDFLMVGSMGHASQIALGLAIAKPKRTVVCLDGDGALIMHLGGLTTIGKMNPKNLIHVVLNNGTHESVGGQTTAGFLIDFTTIACKSGYNVTFNPLVNKIQVIHAIDSLLPLGGPIFLDIHIHNGIRDGIGKLKTCHVNDKNEFTKNIRSN